MFYTINELIAKNAANRVYYGLIKWKENTNNKKQRITYNVLCLFFATLQIVIVLVITLQLSMIFYNIDKTPLKQQCYLFAGLNFFN